MILLAKYYTGMSPLAKMFLNMKFNSCDKNMWTCMEAIDYL